MSRVMKAWTVLAVLLCVAMTAACNFDGVSLDALDLESTNVMGDDASAKVIEWETSCVPYKKTTVIAHYPSAKAMTVKNPYTNNKTMIGYDYPIEGAGGNKDVASCTWIQWEIVDSGEAGYKYIRHARSGKYLLVTSKNNGSPLVVYGPNIPGDIKDKFKFKFEKITNTSYRIKNKYSGRYVCHGPLMKNNDFFHLWSPIPKGHEDRYLFYLMGHIPGNITK